MRRRFVSGFVLAVLVVIQAAPLATAGPACPMVRAPTAISRCHTCDASPGADKTPALSAGSCCRFEAASPTSAIPGVVPVTQRVQNPEISPACDSATHALGRDHWADSSAGYDSSRRRSDSPVTRNNTLRL